MVVVAWAAAPFEGKFQANGKDANLNYLVASKGEPFGGKPTVNLVFTEKDASKDAKAEMHAHFGDLGDALVIHLMKEGDGWDVIGSEFMHSALKHSGASATGVVSIKNARTANGEISGDLVTSPGADLFGEALAVNLHFQVKQP